MINKLNSLKAFYLKESKKLDWLKEPKIAIRQDKNNHYTWFPDGQLNLYENCITKYLKKKPNKIAIITVDKNKDIKKYNLSEIDRKVNNAANYIQQLSPKKNLRIMIHTSASIESAVLMLACAKLGLHFSVIFEELEALGIKNRLKIFKPNIFFSRIYKKNFLDKIKFRLPITTKFIFGKDIKKILDKKKNNFEIKNENNNSSKSLFTLFTSGSTGKPKGITHSTGGYLLYSKLTCQEQFGMNENSIVLSASDAGWINGHTYSLFGPLSLGSTTILIEKPISLIDIKLLKKILALKVSVIYLPVTLIRLIKSLNKNFIINKKFIRTLGSMGEPLAPSVARWFSSKFLNKNKVVINTYFQTETGGIICSPKYYQSTKQVPHGSVGETVSKYVKINKIKKKGLNEIKITTPWPGMMKNVINSKKEWDKYWDEKSNFRLFDLATKIKKNIYIHGRNDDVINIRGHRIGSEEIESTLLKIKKITECCVVTLADPLVGSRIYLFVVSDLIIDNQIDDIIISNFGTYAIPKKIFYVNEIPKTRSGKILRRILRDMLTNPNLKDYGDTTTILNPGSIKEIQKILKLNG